MKVCGIIAEYNPFHNGHALHISQTRAILGADTAIVCVMSGNFVQRGAPAMLEKYLRAAAAVQCGVDLVLELPLSAAISSAEGFAQGAVAALEAFGSVGYLSFGSECGSVRALQQCVAFTKSEAVEAVFRHKLQEGLSYAAAREQSVAVWHPELAALLASPNNVLGLEYCRALDTANSLITPLSIRRHAVEHDSSEAQEYFASASYLRTRILQNDLSSCASLMPDISYQALQNAYHEGATQTAPLRFDAAIVSYLRRLSAQQLTQYERTEEGFTNRLFNAIQSGRTFEEICANAQTRRYPLARVRRALLRTFLDVPFTAAEDPIAYLRVLAIGAKGRELLHNCHCQLPLITKPLHEKKLPAAVQPALQRDIRADELFHLTLPATKFHAGGNHFRKTPYCLK